MGNYTCECNDGYSCDGFNCFDVDECLEAPDDVECAAEGSFENTEYSYGKSIKNRIAPWPLHLQRQQSTFSMKTNVVTLMSAKKAHMIARLTQHAYTTKMVMTATVLMVSKVMTEMTSDGCVHIDECKNVQCDDNEHCVN